MGVAVEGGGGVRGERPSVGGEDRHLQRGHCKHGGHETHDGADMEVITVQPGRVTTLEKIPGKPDMLSLHYFFNDQLSLSDSVLS